MGWINDMWSRKTASEIPFGLTGDGSDAGKSQEIHEQLAGDHKAISTGMDEVLRHAEHLSKQFANNPQMLAQLSKILNKIHNDTEGNQISMSDHMRALRGLTSGIGHYDRLDAYHFLTEPEFETQKTQQGYKPTYLGSSWAFRYATTTIGFNPFDYAQPLPGSNRKNMRWQLHQPFDINGHTLSHFITSVGGPTDDNHMVSNVFPADLTGNIDVDHPTIDSGPMIESSGRIHNHSNHELAHLEAFKNFIHGTRGLLVPEEGR